MGGVGPVVHQQHQQSVAQRARELAPRTRLPLTRGPLLPLGVGLRVTRFEFGQQLVERIGGNPGQLTERVRHSPQPTRVAHTPNLRTRPLLCSDSSSSGCSRPVPPRPRAGSSGSSGLCPGPRPVHRALPAHQGHRTDISPPVRQSGWILNYRHVPLVAPVPGADLRRHGAPEEVPALCVNSSQSGRQVEQAFRSHLSFPLGYPGA